MDMRFAGPRVRLGALEVGFGVIHGNRGLQYLTKLISHSRTMEHLLSAGTVNTIKVTQMGG